MSDNVPAIRPTTEVATADTDSWLNVMSDVVRLAAHIADTEFVPRGLRGSAPATAAAILYGREVGLPPMTALNMTYVVEGKPAISAEAMRALVLAAGHELEFVESTGAVCRMRARRRGSETWTELAWTLDMARAAGLLGKAVWKSYPRALLAARCSTELCRMVFPDVIHGFRSLEELEDMGTEDGDTGPVAALSGATTKVSRQRKTPAAKKGAPPPAEPRPDAPALTGPPLPGEPGYDVTPGDGSVSGSDDEPEAARETLEDPDTAPAEDVVEAEIVADTSDTSGEEGAPDIAGSVSEPATSSPEAHEEHPESPRPMSAAQRRMLMSQFKGLEIEDRDERLRITATIINRDLSSSNELSHHDAGVVIDTLGRARDYNSLLPLLEAIEKEREEHPE